jgi:hypothetical protein
MGKEWIENIPRGIDIYKKYEKDRLSSLFTDGKKLYWRLKFFNEKQIISDPGQIVEILITNGKEDESGQKIEYKDLVEKLHNLKQETLQALNDDRSKKASGSVL